MLPEAVGQRQPPSAPSGGAHASTTHQWCAGPDCNLHVEIAGANAVIARQLNHSERFCVKRFHWGFRRLAFARRFLMTRTIYYVM